LQACFAKLGGIPFGITRDCDLAYAVEKTIDALHEFKGPVTPAASEY
jgi:hypothetical protein